MAREDDESLGLPMGLAPPQQIAGRETSVEDIGLPRGLTPPSELPEPASPFGSLRQPVTGFAETPGGAATGLQREPQERPRVTIPPGVARVGLEAATSVIPGSVGLRLGGRAVGLAAEVIGATGGSVAAQTFDPTAEPTFDALISGGLTLVGAGGSELLKSTARRLIGRPVGRGKELLDFLEAQGTVPPPGAILEGSLPQALNSIGRADAIYGARIEQMMSQAAGSIDVGLRKEIAGYLRFKRTADRAFKSWDDLRKTTLGESRVVVLDPETIKALDAAAGEFERVGAASQLDNSLLSALAAAKEQIKEGASVFKLSMREAEAARTLLYAQANMLKIREAGAFAQKTVGGMTPSSGVRKIAEETGDAMDRAIDIAIKDGRMPKEATKVLGHARALWKEYKQGQAIVDELLPTIKTAGSFKETINSGTIKAAVKRLHEINADVGRHVVGSDKITNLAKIGRLMETLEQAGQTSAFQYSVRAGQAIALTGAITGTVPSQTLAIALTPPVVAWLVTNEKAISFLLHGMKAAPGSAAAMRAMRQLMLLGAKEGVLAPPEREPFAETPGGAVTGRGQIPSQNAPTSPEVGATADPFRFGRMRANMAPSDPMQAVIAPLEHREFVEEAVGRNPMSALPLTLAIPAYSALKGVGALPRTAATSPATLDEVFAGFEGIERGLRARLGR